jgi:hypothetical protein
VPILRPTSVELLTFQNRGWINLYRRVARFAVPRILPSIPSTPSQTQREQGNFKGESEREGERETEGEKQ